MDDQNLRSEMSKAARTTLHNFFLDKVMSLDNSTRLNYSLTKQQQIRALEYEITNLIKVNKYSFFEIVILEPNCDDIENIDTGIIVKNFQYFSPERPVNKYRIVIDQTWSGYTIYQRSLDDLYWNKLSSKKTNVINV